MTNYFFKVILVITFLLPLFGMAQPCELIGSIDLYAVGSDGREKVYRPSYDDEKLKYDTESSIVESDTKYIDLKDVAIVWDDYDGFFILFDKNRNVYCSEGSELLKRPEEENLLVWTKSGDFVKLKVKSELGVHPINNLNENDEWPLVIKSNDMLMSVYFEFGRPALTLHVSNKEFMKHQHVVLNSLNNQTASPQLEDPTIAVATTGQLIIKSKPKSVEVWLNDEYFGETPIEKDMPGGDYIMELKKDGFETIERSLKVINGEVVSERFVLNRKNEPVARRSEDVPSGLKLGKGLLLGGSIAGLGAGGFLAFKHFNDYNRYQDATNDAEQLRKSAQFAGTAYPMAIGVGVASVVGTIMVNAKLRKKKNSLNMAVLPTDRGGVAVLTLNF